MRAKILIIDPEIDFHQTTLLIVGERHSVTHTYSLAQAKIELSRNSFDLILMETVLPDGDGMDFCTYLKKTLSKMPAVIFVTKSAEPFKEVLAFSIGADDYIQKPLHSRRLRARINARLERIPHLANPYYLSGNGTL